MMGVGGAKGKKESVQEGAGSVITQTGSVRVAASQSNNVIRETSWEEPEEPATDASLGATTDASLGTTTDASVKYNKSTMEGGGCVNTQTGSVRVAASQSNIVVAEDSLEMGSKQQTDANLVATLEVDLQTDASMPSSAEEVVMMVGSKQHPSHHSEGSHPPQSPPTIAEKGVEGGDGGGVSVTKDIGTDASLGMESSNTKKSTVRGRRCVNTQTGSVRVAVSQSNNVIFGHTVDTALYNGGVYDKIVPRPEVYHLAIIEPFLARGSRKQNILPSHFEYFCIFVKKGLRGPKGAENCHEK